MKNFCLLFLLLLVFTFSNKAQTIINNLNTFSIDTMGSKHIVGKRTTRTNDSSAVQDISKRTIFWFEPGDGFYSKEPTESHTISSVQGHHPLMLTTNIYDTTRIPPPSNFIFNGTRLSNSINRSTSFTNDLTTPGVKITPNIFDIVPGDTMIFALTYKTNLTPVSKGGIQKKDSPTITPNINPNANTYKLYFFYNNAATTFTPINNILSFGQLNIDNVRAHFAEGITFNQTPPFDNESFNHSVCFTIPAGMEFEKTVFVSLVPDTSYQKIGTTGSVYAVLTDESNQIIGTDRIDDMLVSPAHDPNYIVQKPTCLLYGKDKRKQVYPMEYKAHFQNTGGGPAGQVKLILHLPKGVNWNSFQITKAMFAGADYTNVFRRNVNYFIDPTMDTLTVYFDKDALGTENKLCGTSNCENPHTNRLTMGEIEFKINTTPNTEDTLKAYADILFKSIYPSNHVDIHGYEDTVRTNIATSIYKECCDCPPPVPCCYLILGLCWWWWLIILLVILLIWCLITKRKRSKKELIYQPTNKEC